MAEMAQVAELRQSVDELREEVQVLRSVVDELRELLEWAMRNPDPTIDQWRQARRIFSMPLDLSAPDFASRINEVAPEKPAPANDAPKSQAENRRTPKDQRHLF